MKESKSDKNQLPSLYFFALGIILSNGILILGESNGFWHIEQSLKDGISNIQFLGWTLMMISCFILYKKRKSIAKKDQ